MNSLVSAHRSLSLTQLQLVSCSCRICSVFYGAILVDSLIGDGHLQNGVNFLFI